MSVDNTTAKSTVQIAVAVPLRRLFDYVTARPIPPGTRVKVPFGTRKMIGVAVSNKPPSTKFTLKPVGASIDADNLFGDKLLKLIIWAANYYHYPIGEALHFSLPPALRGGKPALPPKSKPKPTNTTPPPLKIKLNATQNTAVTAITKSFGEFNSFLLHGITGSGKTEVYLAAATAYIKRGGQVLILVPEIALTPQLIKRVEARFGEQSCVLHSGLTRAQRYRAWWRARSGEAVVVVGTRSAIFTPLKSLQLVLVDEEHDISYKQQDGFRYNARDLAIKRAQLENIPVVLGSATPAMETQHNADQDRHRILRLPQRVGSAKLPRIAFLDLNKYPATEGITAPLLRAIKTRLNRGEQSIIFLNRRGFAPVAQCKCGWQVMCPRCQSRLTYHRDLEQFRCHHCNHAAAAEMVCTECGSPIFLMGVGTQRLEKRLSEAFPEARIIRLDRDRTATAKKLETAIAQITSGKADIIIGTQLIVKGHDFSQVTLVGVINSDQGLYSLDFRAPEYLFQQLVQVSGRAGRGKKIGEVLIQTAHPQHQVLQSLLEYDFSAFAKHCLAERKAAGYPPYRHLALWRAEATSKTGAMKFLRRAAEVGERIRKQLDLNQVQIFDAVVAPMEKLAGRYRAQLLVRANARGALQKLMHRWCAHMESEPAGRRARWSVDIDPMEMF